jgi:FKBP-type peptidyl-prolyl cis-trans isomerase 2
MAETCGDQFGKLKLGHRATTPLQEYNLLNEMLEVGALVRLPTKPDWGRGQVQSIIGTRITVNFENEGKVVLNGDLVSLVLDTPDWL